MLRAGLKFLIKDALRGARYTVRQSTHAHPPVDFPGLGQLTRIADTVLTSIEETVVTLRYGSDQADEMIRAALGDFSGLAEAIDAHDFDARFASTTYRLSKAILARRGLDTIYSSELAYAAAARQVIARFHARREPWQAARFAAEVSGALIEAVPIRGLPIGTDAGTESEVFRTATNEACAFALGLAVTAWLTKGDGVSPVDCVDSASAIVGAAHARMAASLQASDPAAVLAAIFAELAPFVP